MHVAKHMKLSNEYILTTALRWVTISAFIMIVRTCIFQLGGTHRHHQRSVNTQIFQKLPGRLGFSLSNLIDESVLQEG